LLKIKQGILGIVLFNIAALGFSGPFGFEMGMTLEEVAAACTEEPIPEAEKNVYMVKPRKSHPNFSIYTVSIDENVGLYNIQAFNIKIPTSVYGTQLKTFFQSVLESLERVYGKGAISDYLYRGSIWNEPRDWMMSLIKQERILLAVWENGGETNLPDDIERIVIAATALQEDTGSVFINYVFVNAASVVKALQEELDSVF
jgi:hypothetical protein